MPSFDKPNLERMNGTEADVGGSSPKTENDETLRVTAKENPYTPMGDEAQWQEQGWKGRRKAEDDTLAEAEQAAKIESEWQEREWKGRRKAADMLPAAGRPVELPGDAETQRRDFASYMEQKYSKKTEADLAKSKESLLRKAEEKLTSGLQLVVDLRAAAEEAGDGKISATLNSIATEREHETVANFIHEALAEQTKIESRRIAIERIQYENGEARRNLNLLLRAHEHELKNGVQLLTYEERREAEVLLRLSKEAAADSVTSFTNSPEIKLQRERARSRKLEARRKGETDNDLAELRAALTEQQNKEREAKYADAEELANDDIQMIDDVKPAPKRRASDENDDRMAA